jgi:UDP-3-O-[3-hydroxymyristoyl] glucosamine N-acyltransferase
MTETVSSLATLLGGRVVGNGSLPIVGVADLRMAGTDRIGFVRDVKYRDAARATKLGALIVYEELETQAAQIVVADVGLAFAKVALHFHPVPRARQHSIHPTATVHPEAKLEAPVEIGPNAVVGKVAIGSGTVIMAGAFVGDGTKIGRDCVLYPRVVCYHGLSLGDRVVIHAGAVIGSDGFGYARDGAKWTKVPQLGGVRIDDDVEIGANCTIDRGAIGDTKIGARTKIDNLCHFGHNCVVGEDGAFAGATFVAGSTVFGDRVTMAGHVSIGGHRKIGDDVRIGGNSCVLIDVEEPGDYMGYPVVEKRKWIRLMAAQRDLLELQDRVEELRRAVEGNGGTGSEPKA